MEKGPKRFGSKLYEMLMLQQHLNVSKRLYQNATHLLSQGCGTAKV